MQLHAGDFTKIQDQKYSFIFCDAMHDTAEIDMNLDHLLRLSTDDCIWAIHDVYPCYTDYLQSKIQNIKSIDVADSLAVFSTSGAHRRT